MMCAWKAFLAILPPGFRDTVDKLSRDTLQELRLYRDRPIWLRCQNGDKQLSVIADEKMMEFIFHSASRYSPWLAASSGSGYLTSPGGHRIGICGEIMQDNGNITGFRQISSMNIRIARDFRGISKGLEQVTGSILILGKPGAGKTTLLRDLIRQRSYGTNIGVVDQRQEIFPPQANFDSGIHTDILSGCPKAQGIHMLLRTMTPEEIAVDEITAWEDCQAILEAAWCGVTFIATAHAESCDDLLRRDAYRVLLEHEIFQQAVILRPDKSWRLERISLCK